MRASFHSSPRMPVVVANKLGARSLTNVHVVTDNRSTVRKLGRSNSADILSQGGENERRGRLENLRSQVWAIWGCIVERNRIMAKNRARCRGAGANVLDVEPLSAEPLAEDYLKGNAVALEVWRASMTNARVPTRQRRWPRAVVAFAPCKHSLRLFLASCLLSCRRRHVGVLACCWRLVQVVPRLGPKV